MRGFSHQVIIAKAVLAVAIVLAVGYSNVAAADFYCIGDDGEAFYIPRDTLFSEVARQHNVPVQILRAIAKTESKFDPHAIHINKNGTFDFGLMQVNSSWYAVLGAKTWNRLDDPCVNASVGASILADCMRSYGATWEAVGCYNARSTDKRVLYVQKVMKNLRDN